MFTSTRAAVDDAFIVLMAFSFLAFALIIFFTVLFAVRYRRSRHPRAVETGSGTLIEVLWIGVAVVIALAMFFYGRTGYLFLRRVPADSMHVAVEARQWSWLFTYDGGKKSTDLVVPQGRNVSLAMTSPDVLHGFFVPAYRIKQDVVPGMTTRVWFKAESPGSADILCTQYCGQEHSRMLGKVYVVPPADFEKWMNDEDVDIPGLTSMQGMPEGSSLLATSGCLGCHSLDGKRLVGPTFKALFGSRVEVSTGGKARTVTVDKDYLARAIREPSADIARGFEGIMPAPRWSDEQVGDAVEAIAALK